MAEVCLQSNALAETLLLTQLRTQSCDSISSIDRQQAERADDDDDDNDDHDDGEHPRCVSSSQENPFCHTMNESDISWSVPLPLQHPSASQRAATTHDSHIAGETRWVMQPPSSYCRPQVNKEVRESLGHDDAKTSVSLY